MMSWIQNLPQLSVAATILWKITLLLSTGWVFHFLLLRRNPRWRVLLWRGIIMGSFLLPALEIIGPRLKVQIPPPEAVRVAAPGIPYQAERSWPRISRPVPPVAVADVPAEPTILDLARENVGILLLISWGVIALALAARIIAVWFQVRRIIKSSSSAPNPLVRLVQQIAFELGCRRNIRLRMTSVLSSPFLTGILRALIIIPKRLLERPYFTELPAVLAHEVAHLRTNDLVWIFLAKTFGTIFWFHPLAWKIPSAHGAACEEICDAVAAEYVGGTHKYSGMLARFALELLADAPAHGGAAMISASRILKRLHVLKRGISAASLAKRWVVSTICTGLIILAGLGSVKLIYAEKQEKEIESAVTDSDSGKETTVNPSSKVKREGNRVWIKGVEGLPKEKDAYGGFMMALAAAMRTLGQELTYKEAMGLSGFAFRIQWTADEWCDSAPCAPCGFHTVRALMETLGYSYRELMTDRENPDSVRSAREAFVRSIQSGRPVLALDLTDPTDWGLICGYEDEGETLLCRGFGGPTTDYWEATKFPWLAFVIGDKGVVPSHREQVLRSLQIAVEQARTGKIDQYVCGFEGSEKWIGDLTDDARFQEMAQKKGLEELTRINSLAYASLIEKRLLAAEYLRSIAPDFRDEGAARLTAAADLYEQVAYLLKIGAADAPAPHSTVLWTQAMRHAEADSLRESLSVERRAIAEIEKALEAQGIDTGEIRELRANPSAGGSGAKLSAKVRREGDKVWIEGVPAVEWGQGKGCTYTGAFEAAASVTPNPWSYSDLMGVSGLAFRVRWCNNEKMGWCPSTPIGELPEEQILIDKATGWRQDTQVQFGDADFDKGPVIRRIVESIDRGVPVLIYPSNYNMAVAYGYENEGETLLVRDYMADYYEDKESIVLPAKDLGPMQVYLEPAGDPLPARDRLIQGLRVAARNWHREHGDGGVDGRDYWYGAAAYDQWIADLEKFESLDLNEEKAGQFFHLNWWNFTSLVDARNSVGFFLRENADALGEEAREALLRAATIYEEETKFLDHAHGNKDAFLGPWSDKSIDDWTVDVRRRERDMLARAKKMDAAAIAEIEKALEAEGVEIGKLREARVNPDEFPGLRGADSVTLKGRNYQVAAVDPGRLAQVPLLVTGSAGPRGTADEYGGHADPLYNIHCELGPDQSLEKTDEDRQRHGKSWGQYWQELAEALSPKVNCFAYVAYADGKIAGYVRFFPGSVSRLRCVPRQQQREHGDDVLLIGAGYVDSIGVEHELDDELVRRVVEYARAEGYAKIRALGWSNIRVYAMWGESFPTSTYEAIGFRKAATIDISSQSGHTFEDMLAGSHGKAVQKLAQTAVDSGFTVDSANRLHVMEFDLQGGTAGSRTGRVASRGVKPSTPPKSAMLHGVPHGKGNSNSYARGLDIVLNYLGAKADYDTIMGDTGQAFIIMSEEGGPLIDGAVDVGWWPMAAWGIKLRLHFLAETVGRELRAVEDDLDAYRADPAAHYRTYFDSEVKRSIGARRPVLAQHAPCFVVTGYDENDPPLLGDCPLREEKQTNRMEGYPWGLIVPGKEMEPMDRKKADLDAIRHAVALGRDSVEMNVPVYWSERLTVEGRFTGQRSFELWAQALRDTEHLGQARWHANMVLHLGINRTSAVAYLRTMAERHPENVAQHLKMAAGTYEKVLAEVGKADTSETAMTSKTGREKLAKLVEQIAGLEAQAIDHLARALDEHGIELPVGRKEGLTTMMNLGHLQNRVKREGNKVFIEGFGEEFWGREPGTLNSVMYTYSLLMNHLGDERVTYDELMGVSGAAFRIQIMEAEGGLVPGLWGPCPSSPHSNCGFQCNREARNAFGLALAHYEAKKGDTEAERKRRGAIVQSIDRGIPVLYEEKENGLIVGYFPDDESKYLLRYYAAQEDGYSELTDWSWGYAEVLTQRGELRPTPENRLNSLKLAVRLAHAERFGPYLSGFNAYEYWIAGLENDEGYADCDKDPMPWGNAWCFENLVDSRAAAARYLRSIKGEYKKNTAAHLEKAADLYERIGTTLAEWQKKAPNLWELNAKEKWTGEFRESEATVLKTAMDLERKAVTEIEKALAAEDIDVRAIKADAARVSSTEKGDTMKQLEGLKWEPMWTTHIGCLKGCVDYLGVDATDSWLFGASGHAFALNIHEELCPSGPTAWKTDPIDRLAGNVGVSIEGLGAHKSEPFFASTQEEVWKKICAAIDQGHPCFGWELDIPEYYVIKGYNQDSYIFVGHGAEEKTKAWKDHGESEIGVIEMMIVRPGKAASDNKLVRDALEYALEVSQNPEKWSPPKYEMGLAGYDLWVKALEEGKAGGFGNSYNAQVWSECRRHAVEFLKEAKKRLDGEQLNPLFDQAIGHYEKVAENLTKVAETYPFEGDDADYQMEDEEKRRTCLEALRTVRTEEEAGLGILEQIVAQLSDEE